MQQIANISILDLYFFARLMKDPVAKYWNELDSEVRPVAGEGWKDRFPTEADAWRASVESMIKEEAEARDANTELVVFRDKFIAWRRYLEGVARRLFKTNAKKAEVLLRAVGYGEGSPDGSKETKDFLVNTGNRVKANSELLKKLGANDESLAFASLVQEQEETASAKVAKEVTEAVSARKAMRREYDVMFALADAVLDGATSYRNAAVFSGDKARLAKADEILTAFETAIGQARVQARQKQAADNLPPDITEPVKPDPTNPPNNDG